MPSASGASPSGSARASDHAPGEVLAGKYRLEHLLGQGGMGTVWRARSLVLEIDVAVKVVPGERLGSDGSSRLLREARAAASLGHPSIVRVFDFGATEQGEPFLVMELLEGGSLDSLLDDHHRIPAGTAVRLMLPVVSALVSAHARGIVHRDIKPANVMLVPGEGDMLVPKLVDFGIVKLQGGDSVATLTDKGTLIGSPEYMSPEQARGLVDVDAKTDIWSVCVVLYELITGVRPFAGPNHGAVLYAIFSATPEPSVARAAGDDALWAILARGLQKDPADRWPDARSLGRELAGWAAAHGITTDAAGMSIAEQWLGRASSVDLGDGRLSSSRRLMSERGSGPITAPPTHPALLNPTVRVASSPSLPEPAGRSPSNPPFMMGMGGASPSFPATSPPTHPAFPDPPATSPPTHPASPNSRAPGQARADRSSAETSTGAIAPSVRTAPGEPHLPSAPSRTPVIALVTALAVVVAVVAFYAQHRPEPARPVSTASTMGQRVTSPPAHPEPPASAARAPAAEASTIPQPQPAPRLAPGASSAPAASASPVLAREPFKNGRLTPRPAPLPARSGKVAPLPPPDF